MKKPATGFPAFGDEIARLRTKRKLSRSGLIKRLYNFLPTDDDSCEEYSESWLARLETGQLVKIPRSTITVLADALECTPRERSKLLLLADKNILFDPVSPMSAVVEVINYQALTLFKEVHPFLSDLMQKSDSAKLSDDEQKELFISALEMVIDDYRSQNPPQS